jgi:hypothetical protein
MKRKLYFISIFIVFTSCAKKIIPSEGYNQINNSKAVNIFESNKSVAKALTANEDYKNELTLSNSVIKYNDSLKSNYQKFNFKVKPGKNYKIKVSSLCNCSGFKKFMFIPQIVTGNLNNSNIAESDSTYINYEKGPLTFNRVWNLKSEELNENTEFEFLLFSDNTKLSENIYRFIINPIAFVPLNVKSTLTGKFVIKIEEN